VVNRRRAGAPVAATDRISAEDAAKTSARPRACRVYVNWEGKRESRRRTEPKLWAVERNRGLDKATKSGISFRYLGLRVARAEPGVNPGPVKIDEKCYSADTGSAAGAEPDCCAAAAQEMAGRRELLLARLHEQGALTLDLNPEALTSSLLNQYLTVKERAMV
jgi:hypothetical protein